MTTARRAVLGLLLLASLSACVGYVEDEPEPPYYYGSAVFVDPFPETVIYYQGVREERYYRRRGAASRRVVIQPQPAPAPAPQPAPAPAPQPPVTIIPRR